MWQIYRNHLNYDSAKLKDEQKNNDIFQTRSYKGKANGIFIYNIGVIKSEIVNKPINPYFSYMRTGNQNQHFPRAEGDSHS